MYWHGLISEGKNRLVYRAWVHFNKKFMFIYAKSGKITADCQHWLSPGGSLWKTLAFNVISFP